MKTNLISATAILGFSAYYNTSPFKNNPNSVSFTSELQEIKILQNKINMLEALIDYEENHNYAVPQKDLTKITGRCIGTVRSWLNSIHVGLRSSLNEKKAALTALKKDLDQYNKDDVAFILNNQNTHDKNWILQMEQNEDAKKIINCIIKYLSTTGKIPATNYIAQEINQSAPTVRKRMIEYGITSALNSTEELQELLQKIESGNFVKVKQVHNTENQENLPLIINMMRQRKLTLEGKEPININDINSKPKKPTPTTSLKAQILYKAPKPKATPTIQPIRSFVPINKSLDNDKRVISSTASIDTFREVIPYSKISHVIVLASYLLDNNPEIEMKDMINQISIKTKITPQNVETILNAYRFKDI